MTGRTHDLAGFTVLHYVLLAGSVPQMSIATAIGAIGANMIGSLAPDIDQPTGELWNKIPAGSILGRLITPILGSHRMISHSLVGIVITGYLLRWLLAILSHTIIVDMSVIWWTFMIGFVSHITFDTFTKEGVTLFFPIPIKIGFPPLAFFRIQTGGIVEKTILYPLLMLSNGYLVYANYTAYLPLLQKITHQ